MTDGIVRKVFVCFFNEGGHAGRTPVERVAVDIQIDGENDIRDGRTDQASDEGDTRRRRDEDRSLDPTSLQVRAVALFEAYRIYYYYFYQLSDCVRKSDPTAHISISYRYTDTTPCEAVR